MVGRWLVDDVVHRVRLLYDPFTLGAHRLNLLKHLIDGYTVEDNQPDVGKIRWTNLHIVYAGTDYTITDGNTANKYAWWDYSVSTTVLQTTDTMPTLADADMIVFLNKNGTHVTVPITTAIDGSLIVTESILTNALSANCVTGVKILAGEIIAEKLATDSVIAIKIKAGEIDASKMKVGTITAVSGIIADLAVETAKIKDLAVETIKIKNNAASDKADVYTAEDITITTPEVTLATLNFTTIGGRILIMISTIVKYISNEDMWTTLNVLIYRDSSIIYQATSVATSVYTPTLSFNAQISDTPTIGTYTYSLRALATHYNSKASNRAIYIQELKK